MKYDFTSIMDRMGKDAIAAPDYCRGTGTKSNGTKATKRRI